MNCEDNMGIIEGNVPSIDLNDCDTNDMIDIILSPPIRNRDSDCCVEDFEFDEGLLGSDAANEAEPSGSSNSDEEPGQREFVFSPSEESVEVEDTDFENWRKKPTEEWYETDSIDWLLWAATQLGQSYGQTCPYFAKPGSELLRLTKQDFFENDSQFGEKLYDLLPKGRDSNNCQSSQVPSSESLKMDTDDGTLVGRDEEPVVVSDSTEQPQFRRPRLTEYIIKLLINQTFFGWIIRWENYEEKSFRFLQPEIVAELWGQLNGNPHLKFESFTRAIRYYYDKGIFACDPRRHVYRFGRNAAQLLLGIDNVNFE